MFQLFADISDGGGVFNLLRYITVRAGCALATSLLLGFLLGPPLIGYLRRQFPSGHPIYKHGPAHESKSGTPTMGGLLIIGAMIVSTLLWAKLDNYYIWITLLTTAAFAGIGLYDDWNKLKFNNNKGFSWKIRLILGLIIGMIVGYLAIVTHPDNLSGVLSFPLFIEWQWQMGLLFLPFSAFVVAGSANAVNLTDGLDGLAIVPIMIAAGTLGIIAYSVGRTDFSQYLDVLYVPGAGELLIVTSSLVGAGLGFLWYNAPPAAVFMGDTGSLGLGGTVGTIAILIKHEIVFAIIGGLFVVEALSVIIQLSYFRLTRKRIFLMAPIHHHFEKHGWKEAQIVIRFWIIALILALVGLASLKVR